MRQRIGSVGQARSLTLALAMMLISSSVTLGDDIDFERDIRPLLKSRCAGCHGAKTQKSGLRLDARSLAFKGGDGGRVIVAGKSGESPLFQRVTSTDPQTRMPPQGAALSEKQIDLLRRWIDGGAVWPESAEDRDAARDKRLEHWAWQPIQSVEPPTVALKSTFSGNDIDRFVLAKLRDKGLSPSPEADRRTLIRRLSYDLTGLPPDPDRVTKFVSDPDPLAYAKLVDEFLGSPHYGERWARHWLDIAHYADTHGFERDQRRDHAWRYRDWVIRALNADLPYDQFLQDQIAGDALRPDDPDAVIATGFLAAGPWDFVGQAETPSPILKRLARADDLDDMVTQVITAACGVTINCARCHDHKLDPIPQRDYYALWSVFSGVKRGNRVISPTQEKQLAERRTELEKELGETRTKLAMLSGAGWSLSDIVGGGDGMGTGKPNVGIDPISGKPQTVKRGFLEGATANQYTRSTVRFVDGVVIPNGGETGEVVVSSTGLKAKGIPRTSGKVWDAIRNGAVNSQFSTKLGDIDFTAEGRSLLSFHANAAITFDLAELRKNGLPMELRLRALAGYFGQTPRQGASFHILLDGETKLERIGIGRDDGLIDIDLLIPETVRFLTLMSTDHGNDIGHDQICFGDARLQVVTTKVNPDDEAAIARLTQRRDVLLKEIAALPEPDRMYGILTETPPVVRVLARGDTEQPKEEVAPGTLSCLAMLASALGVQELTDAERRLALAKWVADPKNPLTRRVIVNRLWQHHFGAGLVETPSDFGLGGTSPSHPELLDWLADRLLKERWSLKALHRVICLSETYRQRSVVSDVKSAQKSTPDPHGINPHSIDAGNRWLWRQNPRRLDAESLRDAVLTTTGKLNRAMFGPGYRDFDYKEEYAPVYTYITADKPELWRRSIYRFVVRTTPHQFLTVLDCPNAANLTPTRNVTTTALQSLALLNDEFMLKQAGYLAARLKDEAGESASRQVRRGFELALGRVPTEPEATAAVRLVEQHGLTELCRSLLNASEFVYID